VEQEKDMAEFACTSFLPFVLISFATEEFCCASARCHHGEVGEAYDYYQ